MTHQQRPLFLPVIFLGIWISFQSLPCAAQVSAFTPEERFKADQKLLDLWRNDKTALDVAKLNAMTVQSVSSALAAGADINVKNNHEMTVLMAEAEFSDNLPVVRYLLAHGADINAEDAVGETALMNAAADVPETPDIVRLLLAHGANINARDHLGSTALMHASRTNIVKLLLESGAEVNVRNKNGDTALMAAASTGSIASVKMLLAHGAEVNARDKFGNSALKCAEMGNLPGLGRPVIESILKAAGAK